MTPDILTAAVLGVVIGAALMWVKQVSDDDLRRRLRREYDQQWRTWRTHCLVFGAIHEETDVYVTGVFLGKKATDVMERLGRPAPDRPPCI